MTGRYALIVATYDYADPGLKKLVAPQRDADSLAEVLADQEIAGFDVTTLVNEPDHVVGEAIGDFFAERRRDELSLLYFSGHGLKDDEGRLFLAMANTRRDRLLFTALSAQSVNDAVNSCRSREKVLILDCCYSGAFPGGYSAKADTAVHTLERFRGGRGKVVLTASDSTQYSFEGNQLSGSGSASVFTRHLVEGLRSGAADQDGDGDIAVDELYSYVYERVVAEMPQQRPKKQDDVEGRIVIARNVRWDLPGYVRSGLGSPIPGDRLHALTNLARLHANGNPTVRARVVAELTELLGDDSKQVSRASAELLEKYGALAGPGSTEHRDAEVRRQAAAEEQERLAREREAQEAQALRDAEVRRQVAAEEQERLARERRAEEARALDDAEKRRRQEIEQARERQARQAQTLTDAEVRPRLPLVATPVSARRRPRVLVAAAVVTALAIVVAVVWIVPKSPTSTSAASPPTSTSSTPSPTRELQLNGHTNSVWSVATAQTGGRPVVVSGSDDKTVRMWDLSTGAPLGAPFTGHASPVYAVATAQVNGRPVAVSGSLDKTIRIWDLADHKPVGAPLNGHTEAVEALATAQLGERTVVVSGSADFTLRVWDLATGSPVGSPLKGHDGRVSALAIAQLNGRTVVVSGSWDKTIRVWDLATGAPVGRPFNGHTDYVYSVAIAQLNGRTVVVSGSVDKTIRVWDLATGAPVGSPWTGHTGEVCSVAIAQLNGRTVVVSGSVDDTIRVWDLATGAPVGPPFTGHTSSVLSLATVQLEGRTLVVSGSGDHTVRVGDLMARAQA